MPRTDDTTHHCPNCEALARRVEELEQAAKPRPIATAPRDGTYFLAERRLTGDWRRLCRSQHSKYLFDKIGSVGTEAEYPRWIPEPAPAAALRCDDLPDRCEKKESWQGTLLELGKKIHVTRSVTPDQMRAVENIEEGMAKWLDR